MFDRLWKSFGSTAVLTDLSLAVQKGEVVCIIGPFGSGKTRSPPCINHLEAIDDGAAFFQGASSFHRAPTPWRC